MTLNVKKSLRNYLITGALILTPLAVTAYIIVSGFLLLDNFLGGVVAKIVGRTIPGVGAVLTVIVVVAVGMIATNVMGRRLIALGETILKKIPIVSVVYTSVKQLFDAFAVQNRAGFKRVVMVEFPRKGLWSVGFLTSHERWVDDPRIQEGYVTVFVPTAPNPTTGFMFVTAKDDLIELDMSIETAFKTIISGGIVNPSAGQGDEKQS